MNVTVETVGPCRKKLLIELPAEVVEKEYAEILKAYARSAVLPGFRKGRAPESLVAKRYGADIEKDLRDRLISQGYHDAVKEQGLVPIEILRVEDIVRQPGQPMSFTVTVDVHPDFELPEYKGLAFEGEKIEVTDEEIQQALGELLERNARYEDVTDRAIASGDLAQIDFEAVHEGRPLAEVSEKAAPYGRAKDFWMLAEEESFLPGLGKALFGMSIGESKTVEVRFPDDFREPSLAGKSASYTVEVKAVRQKTLPALDEEYFKALGVDSEDDLRGRIKADIVLYKEMNERKRLSNEICQRLLSSCSMEIPQSVIDEETRSEVYNIVRNNTSRGATRDQIEEHKDRIFEYASRSAGETVKLRFILDRIAKAESIEAAPSEVADHIRLMAMRQGIGEAEVRENIKKKGLLDAIGADVRRDKTISFLLENAVVNR